MDEMEMWHTILQDINPVMHNRNLSNPWVYTLYRNSTEHIQWRRKCDDRGERGIGCKFDVQCFAHREDFNCAWYWSVNVRYHKICGHWGAFGVTLLIFINKEKSSVCMHAHKHIHTLTRMRARMHTRTYSVLIILFTLHKRAFLLKTISCIIF